MNLKILLATMVLLTTLIACNKNNSSPNNNNTGTTASWVNTNFSVSNTTSVYSMLVTSGGRILAGVQIPYSNPSLFFSTDTGATWHPSDPTNPVKVNGTPYNIKQDPVTGRVMTGSNSAQLNGLFTSTDDGATWVNNPLVLAPVDIAFMNNKTYMAILNGVSPNPPQYLMSSTNDFSSNYVDCTPVPPYAFFRLFTDNGVLFVSVISTHALYRSTNPESKVYTASNAGMTTAEVLRMAKEGSYLFAGTSNGIYRSSDGGNNWTLSNLGFTTTVNDFAVVGTTIYAGLKDSAVYKSSDNGSTWTAYHQGLTLPVSVNCLQVIGNYLLEGDTNSQIFKLKMN